MDNKLYNISYKDVVEMQKGEHKSQKKKVFAVGVSDYQRKKIDSSNIKREVGEIWEEENEFGDMVTWEQKEGYRIKNPRSWTISEPTYPNCKPECADKVKFKLDEKYSLIYGMCTDCALEFETKLKIQGKWEEFERKKMLENAKSFFKDMDGLVEETKKRMEKVEFVNENGSIEDWTGPEGKGNAEKLDTEYNIYKELIIETLEGKRTDVKVL